MSKKIDWSKAPEGAMVLLKNVRDGSYAVSESYDDEAKTWHWPGQRHSFNLMPSMWRIVAERPTTQSWSGEGLPPVGVVCEANFVGSWTEFELRHYGESYVIFKTRNEVQRTRIDFDTCGVKFRPIRTPDQIAADERERFAQELAAAMGKGDGPNALDQARRMYDLGYRKP